MAKYLALGITAFSLAWGCLTALSNGNIVGAIIALTGFGAFVYYFLNSK